ncbi:MAG: outer-membrane lipoprotein carrier protein LolA [Muribaculaceae bacterium]|nr:outer-membrane lipoprotein carrier protein LolA [Muribaculaceae bacterium]
MNKIITTLTALLLPILALALSPQEVVDKAAAKIRSVESLTAKFTGTTNGTLVSSGKKFCIDTGGFGIWYNGTDMWTYSQQTGETTVTSPTPSELLETNPLEIINSYSKRFTATKLGDQGGKYTLKLTPKAKGESVKAATLVIDTRTWLPMSIDMVLSNGSRFTLNIKSISEGNALPTSNFEYPQKKYPGVEVVDLR